MAKPIAANRRRLLEAAEKTTHRYGFGNTAIADIAKQAGIPLGNVYYYFKTKDEIAESIVNLRVSRFRKLLEEFDKTDSPKQRLCAFVNVKMKNREELARHGCPVGTLCSELRKLGGSAAEKSTVLLERLSSGWKGNSGRLARAPIHACWPCIYSPRRKVCRCWRTLSVTPGSSTWKQRASKSGSARSNL